MESLAAWRPVESTRVMPKILEETVPNTGKLSNPPANSFRLYPITKRIVSEVPMHAVADPEMAVAALGIRFVELSRAACRGYGDSIGESALRMLDEE